MDVLVCAEQIELCRMLGYIVCLCRGIIIIEGRVWVCLSLRQDADSKLFGQNRACCVSHADPERDIQRRITQRRQSTVFPIICIISSQTASPGW